MEENIEISTQRLYLRRLREEDGADLVRILSAKEISDTTSSIPHPYTIENAREFLLRQEKSFKEGSAIVLGIFNRSNQEFIGNTGLHRIDSHKVGELGYAIGVPYWNRGYATEAARAIMEFGFRNLNLRKIAAKYYAHNAASGRVMQKIGLKKEGCLREEWIKNGRVCDVILYGLLRQEWEEAVK